MKLGLSGFKFNKVNHIIIKMDNGTQGRIYCCACCVLGFFGANVLLVAVDVEVLSESLPETTYSLLCYSWLVGMCLTLIFALISIPVMLFLVVFNSVWAKGLGVMLLFLGGPNLMFWNVLGCSVDALELSLIVGDESNGNLEVSSKIFLWTLLYTLGVFCSYLLVLFTIKRSRSTRRAYGKQFKVDYDTELLEKACAICMETYTLKERTIYLKCGHDFHKHCVDTWLQQVYSCPVCRRTF